ncbi:hypothetical protein [Catenulispora rubra]|uniref:hypothetical protein n=1 Tax=Catenulispora rubra TaxID=280293 RepID=UPI001892481C|nr:hypothetical protein [Catenulispora rubra]
MLERWLNVDFQWRGQPLAHQLASISLRIADHVAVPLWSRPGAGAPGAPKYVTCVGCVEDSHGNICAGDPMQALHDLQHPLWGELVETLLTADGDFALTGRWMHRESTFTINEVDLATDRGLLYLGCVDRRHPHSPRRYQPALHATADPHLVDIGVISFPLESAIALELIAEGHDLCVAGMAMCATGVIEACVHEALELFQVREGQPAWDPHVPGPQMAVESTFLSDGLRTTAWPCVSR